MPIGSRSAVEQQYQGLRELAISDKYPRLEHLELELGSIRCQELALPALRRLHLRMHDLPTATAQAIARAPLLQLGELELAFDDLNGELCREMLDALLARTDLTALRIVRLANAHTSLVQAVVRSRLAEQLETLDLTDSYVDFTTVNALLAARDRLAALTLLLDPGDLERQRAALQVAYGERLRIRTVAPPFATWRE